MNEFETKGRKAEFAGVMLSQRYQRPNAAVAWQSEGGSDEERDSAQEFRKSPQSSGSDFLPPSELLLLLLKGDSLSDNSSLAVPL